MENCDALSQRSLERLLNAVKVAVRHRKFALYFAEFSLSTQQVTCLGQLRKQCESSGITFSEFNTSHRIVEDVRSEALEFLRNEFSEQIPDKLALAVTGLEAAILLDDNPERPSVLQIMNLGRESYRTSFPFPFLVCLSGKMLQRMQLSAPDFCAWRTLSVKFPVTQDLVERETQIALSLIPHKDWGEAVSRIGRLERLLEAHEVMYDNANAESVSISSIAEFRLAEELGDTYRFLRKYDIARKFYDRALRIREELEDSERRASVLNKLGIIMRETGNREKAFEFFQEYSQFANKRNDLIGQGAALNNIGLIYFDYGDFGTAIGMLKRALEINEQNTDIESLWNTLGNLGLAHQYSGALESAIELHNMALDLGLRVRGTDDAVAYQKDLLNLGVVYSLSGMSVAAVGHFLAARYVSREAHDPIHEKEALTRFAECVERDTITLKTEARGPEIVALQSLLTKLGLYEGTIHGYFGPRTQMALKKIDPDGELLKGALDPAKSYEQALEIARAIRDSEDEYRILLALADMHRKWAGEVGRKRAVSYYEEALEKAQQLRNVRQQVHCLVSAMQLYGTESPDKISEYKAEARHILDEDGTLETGTLIAWLANTRNQIPTLLEKGSSYVLHVAIGEASEVYPEASHLGGTIAKTEFIYNIAVQETPADTEIQNTGYTGAIGPAKRDDTRKLTEYGSPNGSISDTTSDQEADRRKRGQISIRTPDTEVSEMPRGVGSQPQGQVVEFSQLDDSPLDTQADPEIDIQVDLEGSGLEFDRSSDVLRSSWNKASDIIMFIVSPTELGRTALRIKCTANGILSTLMLYGDVVESADLVEYIPVPAIDYLKAKAAAREAYITPSQLQLYQEDPNIFWRAFEKQYRAIFHPLEYLIQKADPLKWVVNLEHTINRIIEFVDGGFEDTPGILILRGLTGSGKTTAIRVLFERMRDKLPHNLVYLYVDASISTVSVNHLESDFDAQIYVGLKGLFRDDHFEDVEAGDESDAANRKRLQQLVDEGYNVVSVWDNVDQCPRAVQRACLQLAHYKLRWLKNQRIIIPIRHYDVSLARRELAVSGYAMPVIISHSPPTVDQILRTRIGLAQEALEKDQSTTIDVDEGISVTVADGRGFLQRVVNDLCKPDILEAMRMLTNGNVRTQLRMVSYVLRSPYLTRKVVLDALRGYYEGDREHTMISLSRFIEGLLTGSPRVPYRVYSFADSLLTNMFHAGESNTYYNTLNKHHVAEIVRHSEDRVETDFIVAELNKLGHSEMCTHNTIKEFLAYELVWSEEGGPEAYPQYVSTVLPTGSLRYYIDHLIYHSSYLQHMGLVTPLEERFRSDIEVWSTTDAHELSFTDRMSAAKALILQIEADEKAEVAHVRGNAARLSIMREYGFGDLSIQIAERLIKQIVLIKSSMGKDIVSTEWENLVIPLQEAASRSLVLE